MIDSLLEAQQQRTLRQHGTSYLWLIHALICSNSFPLLTGILPLSVYFAL